MQSFMLEHVRFILDHMIEEIYSLALSKFYVYEFILDVCNRFRLKVLGWRIII